MSSRVEKERAKQIQDKCQNLLTQMLRDEDNKYCVDCDAKGPRWASWNLGIFLCIRCAGIHRNLGVHISRVKSVNLDTWTPEQVVSLQQMGNSRARAVYEANLPDSFRRPHTDCSLESFIRAKYEHKKYIAREWVPPPVQKVNWDKELDEEAERQRRRKKESMKSNSSSSNQSAALPPVKKPEVVPQLPKPRSSVSPKPNKTSNSATLDLLGLDAPTANQSNANGSGDDIFSSFLSAPPAAGNNTSTVNGGTTSTANSTTTTSTNQAASKTEEENFFNQTAPTAQERSKMTKDSILALYGTPSHQQSVFGAPAGMYSQQQIPNMGAFSQPSNFPNQQSSLNQLNHIPSQLAMPIPNQMAVNPNQIGAIAANPVGAAAMHMGQINQMNGLPNTAMVMQTQMGVANVDPQMMQLGQQANVVGSNNGWTGMIAQNLQPAPGSNPFFNLATQQQPTNAFVTQLPQQMSQMSLSGGLGSFPSPAGKPAATAAFPGQTLSTNLWQ